VLIALIASGFDIEQFRDDLEQRRRTQDGGGGGDVRVAVERLRGALAAWAAR
jgi:hypothetical protein